MPSTDPYLPTMLGSALSGAIARIPTHPIDTLKARLQTLRSSGAGTGKPLDTAPQLFVRIFREEGLRGLYRGLGVTLLLGPFASMLYFGGYEVSRDTLQSRVPLASSIPALTHLGAGLLAEALSCILFVPVDVIKERMQVQGASAVSSSAPGYYRNTAHAVKTILRGEGVSGIYRGYWATVGSFGPFSALYFMFYEALKARALESSESKDVGFGRSLVCSAAAGAGASVLTNPLDLVKLRLQVQRASVGASATPSLDFGYTGLVQGLGKMLREEGGRAMFRGALTRVAFHAPTTAITMALFETCKSSVQGLLRQ